MKPEAAVSRSSSAVAFSWEQEPGVSKQSPIGANKPAARAPTAVAGSKRTPAITKKAAAAETTACPHRLRVPPPPGAPSVSPPGRNKPRRNHGVRLGDDPFLAAYLACTKNGSRDHKAGQKLLGWAGLRLGVGLGLRGFGLSCKSSCEAVEESMVRLAEIPGIREE